MMRIDREAKGLVLQVDALGQPHVVLGDWLGCGAEAEIFRLPGWADGRWAAKVYHTPEVAARKETKLRTMLETPPKPLQAPINDEELPLLAWPNALLRHPGGQLAGFLMPLVEPRRTIHLEDCAHVHLMMPGVDVEDLSLPQRLRLCRNLASIVAMVHERGHYIVDFKPSNLRVYAKAAIPCLLDTDGFSIVGSDGQRIPADAFTPEFASPEIVRGELALEDVTDDRHDCFSLALLFFQVLNGGIHPFQGVQPAESASALNSDGIRDGLYAYGRVPHPAITPTPGSLHEGLPTEIRDMLDRALAGRPAQRPTAAQWRDFLDRVLRSPALFARCKAAPKNALHIHFSDTPCPECAWEEWLLVSRKAVPALAADARSVATVAPAAEAPTASPEVSSPSRVRRIAKLLLILLLAWLAISFITGNWPPALPFAGGV
jgi:DNA-binding helix-hairpin-helix protein with protein kinase domain